MVFTPSARPGITHNYVSCPRTHGAVMCCSKAKNVLYSGHPYEPDTVLMQHMQHLQIHQNMWKV
jgi:hypothetical protein